MIIGAGVRERSSGKLGEVMSIPRAKRMRGYLAVRFPGETNWRHVRHVDLVYVARRYAHAVAFIAAHGPDCNGLDT